MVSVKAIDCAEEMTEAIGVAIESELRYRGPRLKPKPGIRNWQ